MRVPVDLASLHIEELGLSVRCYRTLKHAGVICLRDLAKASEETLILFYAELNVKSRKEAWGVLCRRMTGETE